MRLLYRKAVVKVITPGKFQFGISKDILILELIVEGGQAHFALEVEILEAKEPEGDELHVEIEGHEKVEQLDIRGDVHKGQREHQNDLK